MMRSSQLMIGCLVVFGALFFAQRAQAQDEVELVGGTQAEWQQKLDSFGKTNQIVFWDIRVAGDKPVYYLRMKKGPVRPYQIRTGRTGAAFAELKREYADQGFAFKKQVEYTVNGAKLFGGYWEK